MTYRHDAIPDFSVFQSPINSHLPCSAHASYPGHQLLRKHVDGNCYISNSVAYIAIDLSRKYRADWFANIAPRFTELAGNQLAPRSNAGLGPADHQGERANPIDGGFTLISIDRGAGTVAALPVNQTR